MKQKNVAASMNSNDRAMHLMQVVAAVLDKQENGVIFC
jgi:hypothetical protein